MLPTRKDRWIKIGSIASLIGLAWLIFCPSALAVDGGQNRYVLVRNAETAGNSAAVDDDAFMRLCSDTDGCTITVGVSHWAQHGEWKKAFLFGRPCHFHITADRHWMVSTSCSTRLMAANTGLTPEYGFRPYNSGQQGIDGVSTEGNWRVLNYYGACVLSEHTVSKSVEQKDDSVGFHFWMQSPQTNPQFVNTWNNPQRRCVLLIND